MIYAKNEKSEDSAFKVPLLTSRAEFPMWLLKMDALLTTKKLMGIVTGKRKKLPKQSKDWATLSVTKKKAHLKKVRARETSIEKAWLYLVTACGDTFMSIISPFRVDKDCAKAWKAILRQFGEDNSPLTVHQAIKAFDSLKMVTEGDIQLNFTNFVGAIDRESSRLVSMGESVSEPRKILVLTGGMPAAFKEFNKYMLVNLERSLSFSQACESIRNCIQQDLANDRNIFADQSTGHKANAGGVNETPSTPAAATLDKGRSPCHTRWDTLTRMSLRLLLPSGQTRCALSKLSY